MALSGGAEGNFGVVPRRTRGRLHISADSAASSYAGISLNNHEIWRSGASSVDVATKKHAARRLSFIVPANSQLKVNSVGESGVTIHTLSLGTCDDVKISE